MEHWMKTEIAQWLHHEVSIWLLIAPWANTFTMALHLVSKLYWSHNNIVLKISQWLTDGGLILDWPSISRALIPLGYFVPSARSPPPPPPPNHTHTLILIFSLFGARWNSVVKCLLIVWWVVGSIPHGGLNVGRSN